MKNISVNAVTGLSSSQVTHLRPKAFGGFTAEQMENLPIGAFMALKRRQLAKLNPDAVTGLTAQHLITLSSDEIGAFKATQIKSINPDAISSLKPSAAQVLFKSQALTNEQSAAMGEGQTKFTST